MGGAGAGPVHVRAGIAGGDRGDRAAANGGGAKGGRDGRGRGGECGQGRHWGLHQGKQFFFFSSIFFKSILY